MECTQQECPQLDCPEKDAILENPLDCCKKCPPKKEIFEDVHTVGKTERQILEEGGCKFQKNLYMNGEVWKHRVEPFGEIPCVECSCTVSLIVFTSVIPISYKVKLAACFYSICDIFCSFRMVSPNVVANNAPF